MPSAPIKTARETSRLETLSLELKCAILESLPDFSSLRNTVHASPDYHAAYLSARDAILTRVTFRELWNRNIDLSKPTALVQVCHVRPEQPVAQDVKWVLRLLRRHETGVQQLRTIRGGIVLDVQQCCALLTLGRVLWKPFVCLYDETDLFPHYYPDQAFANEGSSSHRTNRDDDDEREFKDRRCMDAGWDAYYLDDIVSNHAFDTALDRLILRRTEFFMFFPGYGDWWNLVSSS